jgi:hypothetical protein
LHINKKRDVMENFNRMIRTTGWVVVQLFILTLLFCGNVWLIYTNFAALKVSFEYNKYDTTPLGEDPLTGFIWDSLGLYNVTIADMLAAAMAFFVGFLCFVISHHAYIMIRLLLERREYARTNDTALTEQANAAITRNLADIFLTLIPLIPLAIWDIQQFRFRTIVPLLGMEATPEAVKNWEIVLKDHGNLFAVQLVRFGAWAYLFLIIGAGLLFEHWLNYVREAFIRWGAAIQAWYEHITGTTATDANSGNQGAPQAVQVNRVVTQPETQNAFVNNTEQTEEYAAQEQRSHVNTVDKGNGNIEWPEKPAVEPVYTATTAEQNTDEEISVYGAPGEKVMFSVAASDPESYYIDEMRRVWKRGFESAAKESEKTPTAG